MTNRMSPALLVVLGALILAGCESTNAPLGPSAVPESSVAAAPTFVKPGDTDAIVIDKGELDFSKGFGDVRLEGNRGFSLTAYVSSTGGVAGAVSFCRFTACTPDTTIPLFAYWLGNDLVGTVTLDGTTYTQVGAQSSQTSASVQFWYAEATSPDEYRSAGVLAPPFTKRGSDEVTAPFMMSGHFSRPEGRLHFSGEGVVKLWLTEGPGPRWEVARMLYSFKHRPVHAGGDVTASVR